MLLRSYTSVNKGCVATRFCLSDTFCHSNRFCLSETFCHSDTFCYSIGLCDAFCQSSDKTCGDADTICHSRERETRGLLIKNWTSAHNCDKMTMTVTKTDESLYTECKWTIVWRLHRKTPNYVVCSLCVDRSIAALPSCLFSGEVPGPQWIPKLCSFCVSLWWVYCTVL